LLIFLIEMIKDIILQILPLIGDNYDKHSYMAQSAQMWRDTEDWRRANWAFAGLILRPYEVNFISDYGHAQNLYIKINDIRLMYICANIHKKSIIVIHNNTMKEWKKYLTSLNTPELIVYDVKNPTDSCVCLGESDDKIMLVNMAQFNRINNHTNINIITNQTIGGRFMFNENQHNADYKRTRICDGVKPLIVIKQGLINNIETQLNAYNTPLYIISTLDLPIKCDILTQDDELGEYWRVLDKGYNTREIIPYENIIVIDDNLVYNGFITKLANARHIKRKTITITYMHNNKLKYNNSYIKSLVPKNEYIPYLFIRLLTLVGFAVDTLTYNDWLILTNEYVGDCLYNHQHDSNTALLSENVMLLKYT
jgi:hypothetical protein